MVFLGRTVAYMSQPVAPHACHLQPASSMYGLIKHHFASALHLCMAAAPELEELELALNEVTPDGAKELAAALANKTRLQKLNLRENELEDRGVILLSGPIQSLPALHILDLAHNQVCFLAFVPAPLMFQSLKAFVSYMHVQTRVHCTSDCSSCMVHTHE